MRVRRKLGQNIARLRHRAGKTQNVLADLAPMSRRFLQRIEAGTAQPTVETLLKIKHVLKCTWAELLEGIE